ncbi:unnamed protein product, partial [Choristocarpus tenellus]
WYLLNPPHSSSVDYGFSVTDKACMDHHTHTHEIGHNLGCHHNIENADPGLDYAYGYRYCDGTDE